MIILSTKGEFLAALNFRFLILDNIVLGQIKNLNWVLYIITIYSIGLYILGLQQNVVPINI